MRLAARAQGSGVEGVARDFMTSWYAISAAAPLAASIECSRCTKRSKNSPVAIRHVCARSRPECEMQPYRVRPWYSNHSDYQNLLGCPPTHCRNLSRRAKTGKARARVGGSARDKKCLRYIFNSSVVDGGVFTKISIRPAAARVNAPLQSRGRTLFTTIWRQPDIDVKGVWTSVTCCSLVAVCLNRSPRHQRR